MKILLTAIVSILATACPGICGLVGVKSLGALLDQADMVVVATVRDSSAAPPVLSVNLTVIRTLKGSANAGASIPATLSSPNVINPGSGGGVRLNGAVVASELAGKTGLWFLQHSGTDWVVLPLMTGDIFTEGLYLPIPTGDLPPAFAYDAAAPPKTKLMREIGAAAQDPMAARTFTHMEAIRQLADLGSDVQPVLTQLAASSQPAIRATGLAGQIRLGTPAALNVVASSALGALPLDAQGQLVSAVCAYRNNDGGGIAALGILASPPHEEHMRACAVYALREIHSPQTLPLLENLLGDSSARIRYDALIGIAKYAFGFGVASLGANPTANTNFTPPSDVTNDMRQHFPAQGLFLSNEQEYISYWKNWLAAHPVK